MHLALRILFVCAPLFAWLPSYAAPRRCGVIATLSGGHAPIGTSIKNSIILAAQQLPPGAELEFVFEDDSFIPRNTVLAANKLMASDKVDCLIVFGSSTSLAIADLVERAKLPTISIAVSPKMTEGRSYVFRQYIPLENQSEIVLREAAARGYKRIAVVTTTQDATVSLRDLLVPKLGERVVLDEKIMPEEVDLKSIAARVMGRESDAVFLNVLPPQLSNLARQLRAIGFKGEFFAGPPLGNIDEVRSAQNALEGAWFVSVDDRRAGDFYEAYKKKFGEYPAVEGIYGFDLVKVLHSGADAHDLAGYLRGLKDFEGLLGRYGVRNNSFDIPGGLWSVSDSALRSPRAG